ncbi:hypothetical protein D3C87_2037750 [compost metagenome]
MVDLLEEADVLQVRILQQGLEGMRREYRNAEWLQQLAPFFRGLRLQVVGEDFVQHLDVLRT